MNKKYSRFIPTAVCSLLAGILGSNIWHSWVDQEPKSVELSIETEKIYDTAKKVKTKDDPKLASVNGPLIDTSNTPPWDCSRFFCEDGDFRIFPTPLNLATTLAGIKGVIVGGKDATTPYTLLILFDPTCPKCRTYYNKTLEPLVTSGHRIKLIPTIYKDSISRKDVAAVQAMLCSTERNTECLIGVDETMNHIDEVRSALTPYDLQGIVPISLNNEALWLGNLPLDIVIKYMDMKL